MSRGTSKKEDKDLSGREIAGGKYVLDARIGSGSMGQVYRGRHRDLRKEVAVKVLRSAMFNRPKAAERFQREAQAASMLIHRNTVQVLDCGRDHDIFYIVMELLDGVSLDKVLDDRAPLATEELVELMSQVLAALTAAHRRGILHRDIKPENIILLEGYDDDGDACTVAKVCDFGLAKISGENIPALTGVHEVWGTPNSMSPEQAQGLPLDERSDIYACGVLMYQMVTARVPFSGKTPFDIMSKHISTPPVPPSKLNRELNPDLEKVILKSLAKRPEQRQACASDLRRDLRAILQLGDPMSELIPIVEMSPAPQDDDEATVVQTSPFAWSLEIPRVSERLASPEPTAAKSESSDTVSARPLPKTDRPKPSSGEQRSARTSTTPRPHSATPSSSGADLGHVTSDARKVDPHRNRTLVLAAVAAAFLLALVGSVLLVVSVLQDDAGASAEDSSNAGSTAPAPKQMAAVIVSSEPPGASVIINGVLSKAITPAVLSDLEVGLEHTVIVSKAGYQPVVKTVTAESGSTPRLEIVLSQSNAGFVYAECPSAPCVLIVDGNRLGVTPIHLAEVPVGSKLNIQLSRDGTPIISKRVALAAGELLVLSEPTAPEAP